MRPILIISLIIFLTSCGGGYQPLYKKTNSSNIDIPKQFQKIKISIIEDRKGQILRNYLLDILNPKGQPKKPKYLLKTQLTESIQQTGKKADGTYTRSNLTNRTNIHFEDADTRQTLFRGMNRTTSSFDLIDDDLANRQALIGSRDANLRVLSQKIAASVAIAILNSAEEKNIFQSISMKLANNKISNDLGSVFLKSTNPAGIYLDPRYALYISASEINKQERRTSMYIKNLVSYRLVDLKKGKNLLEKKKRISDTVDLKGNDKYNDKAIESTRKGHLDFLAEVIKGEVLRAVTLKR